MNKTNHSELQSLADRGALCQAESVQEHTPELSKSPLKKIPPNDASRIKTELGAESCVFRQLSRMTSRDFIEPVNSSRTRSSSRKLSPIQQSPEHSSNTSDLTTDGSIRDERLSLVELSRRLTDGSISIHQCSDDEYDSYTYDKSAKLSLHSIQAI
eukprot:TRINITY_DN4419_c0_g1_i1.p1 TRINITY_DN4419_c0_g1~~TRINITY_DN4419_c0_g1_i1.p1  ORF type:complete len:174 (+),score=10.72 TRINITY_DN4419_c0_g1_i1:56-523(+)